MSQTQSLNKEYVEALLTLAPPPGCSSYMASLQTVCTNTGLTRDQVLDAIADPIFVGGYDVSFFGGRVRFEKRGVPTAAMPASAGTVPAMPKALVSRAYDPTEVAVAAQGHQKAVARLGLTVPTASEAVRYILQTRGLI